MLYNLETVRVVGESVGKRKQQREVFALLSKVKTANKNLGCDVRYCRSLLREQLVIQIILLVHNFYCSLHVMQ
jgi:hypothetical protein